METLYPIGLYLNSSPYLLDWTFESNFLSGSYDK